MSAPPPPAAAESRPAPRITDADADRAARSVLERLRASDFDALAQGMGTSRTDRDFMAWLRRRPVEMKVGDARPNVTVQPDGSARVAYSVPISWTHASGAKPVRNASIVVTVNDSGKIAGWTLAAPFVP